MDPPGKPSEEPAAKTDLSETPKQLWAESAKPVPKTLKSSVISAGKLSGSAGSNKGRMERKSGFGSSTARSTLFGSGSSRISSSVAVIRRNSTGGLPEKPSIPALKGANSGGSVAEKKSGPSVSGPVTRSLPEFRKSPLPSVITKTKKADTVSSVDRSLRKSTSSEATKHDPVRKSYMKPTLSGSPAYSKRISSSSLDSTGSSTTRKTVSKVSSPSARSPSITSGLRGGSLSSSLDRSSSLSGRRKSATLESRDSRFIVLPQVEVKAGDEVVRKLIVDV